MAQPTATQALLLRHTPPPLAARRIDVDGAVSPAALAQALLRLVPRHPLLAQGEAATVPLLLRSGAAREADRLIQQELQDGAPPVASAVMRVALLHLSLVPLGAPAAVAA